MGSTTVQAPPPRDYYKEMMSTIKAQVDSAPMILEAERRLTPQFQQLQYEQMLGQSKNMLNFYSQVQDPFAKAAGQYATSMGQYAMQPLAQASRSAYEVGLGGGADLQNLMRSQAMEGLQAGTSLTPEMQRQAEQQARASMSARGLAGGNQGVASEVLNSYNMGMERQNYNRNFANQVLSQDANIASNAYAQYGQPMMQGIMTGYSPTGIAATALGLNQNLGGSYIRPEDQMAQNIYAGNYNGQLQANVATAQGNAAIWGGLMGGLGNFAGKYPWGGGCWVAREVYGIDNVNWLIFREWMFNESPALFRKTYLKYGERFAKFISNKPKLKQLIKFLMDLVVNKKTKK